MEQKILGGILVTKDDEDGRSRISCHGQWLSAWIDVGPTPRDLEARVNRMPIMRKMPMRMILILEL